MVRTLGESPRELLVTEKISSDLGSSFAYVMILMHTAALRTKAGAA